MKFLSIKELRGSTSKLKKDLQRDQEIVVTVNGRPFAVMTRVEPEGVEEEIQAIRRARAQAALSRMRTKAKADGLDRIGMDEIDAVIAETRRERRTAE